MSWQDPSPGLFTYPKLYTKYFRIHIGQVPITGSCKACRRQKIVHQVLPLLIIKSAVHTPNSGKFFSRTVVRMLLVCSPFSDTMSLTGFTIAWQPARKRFRTIHFRLTSYPSWLESYRCTAVCQFFFSPLLIIKRFQWKHRQW